MRQGSGDGRLINGGGGPTAIVCVIVMAVIIGLVSLVVNMSDFLDGARAAGSLGSGVYGVGQKPFLHCTIPTGPGLGVEDIQIHVADIAGKSGDFDNLG